MSFRNDGGSTQNNIEHLELICKKTPLLFLDFTTLLDFCWGDLAASLLGRGVGRNTRWCALPELTRAGLGVTRGPAEAGLEVTKGPLETDLDVTKGPEDPDLEARKPGGGVTVTV